MPGVIGLDAYGHVATPVSPGAPQLAGAAAGTTTPGTIAPVTAGAGAGSSVTVTNAQNPTDLRGNFTVVGAGAPAAGNIAVVNFFQPYGTIPYVFVELTNAAAAPINVSATAVTNAGFTVAAGAAISVGNNTVTYLVFV